MLQLTVLTVKLRSATGTAMPKKQITVNCISPLYSKAKLPLAKTSGEKGSPPSLALIKVME